MMCCMYTKVATLNQRTKTLTYIAFLHNHLVYLDTINT